MIIRAEENQRWITVVARRCSTNWTKTILAVLVCLALLSGLAVYGRLPQRVRGLLAQPEQITIDIKQKHYQKLSDRRDEALANGMLGGSAEDFVPARIRYKDKIIEVKLRLKGDMRDHWEGEKWSLRIVVEGDNTLFGMKQFSIQDPRTRAHLYEWIYHQALKREGVLSLRYDFVDVTLNGKHLGVYALEEHFEKRLIEHGQLREGPIVRFNEDVFWTELAKQHYLPVWDRTPLTGSATYLSSEIDAFQTKKALTDPVSYQQYVKAIQLLEAFRRGTLKPGEVFDVPKLAKFFAVSDLMGALHGGSQWTNVRFYYNPVTSRLEPIGFDGYDRELVQIRSLAATLPNRSSSETDDNPYRYIATLFSDREILQAYVAELERVSDESYLEGLFSELGADLQRNLDIIHQDFPGFDLSRDVFYKNQRYIKQVLNPVKGLHAYYRGATGNDVSLELGNIQHLPIEVIGLTYKNEQRMVPATETLLPAMNRFQPVKFQEVVFHFPNNFVWSEELIPELRLDYRIIGEAQSRSETVFRWSHLDQNFLEKDFVRRKSNVERFKFLAVDEAGKRILVKPGVWNLDESLIIGKGYRVFAREGTTLNLSKAAAILSYSPFDFVGSEDYPVTIQSLDNTGQGVVVIGAPEKSILERVVFKNLSAPSHSGWELLGSLNFYESDVAISRCQFVANRSEDALNIIRSEFTIDESLFSQNRADAIDTDFAKGKITRSFFVACGNDAIDVSGSSIDIQDVVVNGAGDKGVSAGENSNVRVSQIEIRGAEIALGSKDMSELIVRGVKMSDCKVGFTAYQKKPEFGAASIRIMGSEIAGASVPYLLEQRSTIVVDGTAIEPNRTKVESELYGAEYGKKSD